MPTSTPPTVRPTNCVVANVPDNRPLRLVSSALGTTWGMYVPFATAKKLLARQEGHHQDVRHRQNAQPSGDRDAEDQQQPSTVHADL